MRWFFICIVGFFVFVNRVLGVAMRREFPASKSYLLVLWAVLLSLVPVLTLIANAATPDRLSEHVAVVSQKMAAGVTSVSTDAGARALVANALKAWARAVGPDVSSELSKVDAFLRNDHRLTKARILRALAAAPEIALQLAQGKLRFAGPDEIERFGEIGRTVLRVLSLASRDVAFGTGDVRRLSGALVLAAIASTVLGSMLVAV